MQKKYLSLEIQTRFKYFSNTLKNSQINTMFGKKIVVFKIDLEKLNCYNEVNDLLIYLYEAFYFKTTPL